MSGIGVVTNPHSRQNRRNPALVERLAYVLGDKGPLAQPASPDAMEHIAQVFLEREIDVLCINGGDGTGHVVLTAFARVYGDRPLPMIALLRGGTMNTVAHGLGIKGSPAELLAEVVRKYHEGEPFRLVERNLLCVDDRYYGFLFGNGLISNYLEVYYEGSEPSPFKAVMLLVRACLSALVGGRLIRNLLRPVQAEVTVDGQRWPAHSYGAVLAGTVDDIGVGFRPFYLAPSHPGHFHALGIATSPMNIVRELPRIFRALPTRSKGIQSRIAQRLRLESTRPLSYMVDGDFHGGGQVVELSMGPRVRLIVG